jgi:HSP20 family protein
MIDRKDHVLIRADVPGLEQKDLRVSVTNGVLTITGERAEEREAKEDEFYCCERWSGSFSRSITLPPGVDADKIQAKFKNGVLEIQAPKSRDAVGKQIEVKAA